MSEGSRAGVHHFWQRDRQESTDGEEKSRRAREAFANSLKCLSMLVKLWGTIHQNTPYNAAVARCPCRSCIVLYDGYKP